VIPLPGIRDKGGAPRLGVKGPHQRGPFGPYDTGDEDDDQDSGEQLDDGPDTYPQNRSTP
jgi:hypothetical protein